MKPYEPKKWRGWMPRHLAILREQFNFRFLTLHHLHALLGEHGEVKDSKGKTHLAVQCRDLVKDGCLAHPKIARATKEDATQRTVYCLTAKGARLLEDYFTERPLDGDPPGLFAGISNKNWEREISHPFVEHELHTATILIAVRLTAERYSIPHRIVYYDQRKALRLPTRSKGSIFPDGAFTLELKTEHGNRFDVDYFLESDVAGNENSPKMTEKFAKYHTWYTEQGGERGEEKHTKVLTISRTPTRAEFLRELVKRGDLAYDSRSQTTWPNLLFADFTRFNLVTPQLLFAPIFQAAHDEKPLQLTEPIMPISLA